MAKINKLNLSILFLVLTFIPLLSAVQIDADTSFNTSVTNLTINFTDTRYADVITVNANWIEFQGYRLTNAAEEEMTFNISEEDIFYNHTSLPYFIASSNTQKTIASGLATTISTEVTFELRKCSDVGVIIYTSGAGSIKKFNNDQFFCNEDLTTITIDIPQSSTNEITWTYGCSAFERIGYQIILIAGALLVLAGVLFFMFKSGILEGLTIGQIILLFVVIIIGVALFVASADIIGSTCQV